MLSNPSLTSEILFGGYDLHIHAAPSPFGRLLDDYALLQQAGKAGLAGIMLKSHYEPTAARAELANQHANTYALAYGSIVLNWPVGGLNPYAVHNALIRGARIVFMPTRDAANSLTMGNMNGDFFDRSGITIVNENGKLKDCIYDIFDLVKQYDAALATGHISPEESMLLCREGRKRGVRMVLTHPEFSRTRFSMEMQCELAKLGVLIEHCWYNIAEHECTAEQMSENICAVGIENCYLSTDRGQAGKERPADALKMFVETLSMHGLSPKELHTMLTDVPKRVLGI